MSLPPNQLNNAQGPPIMMPTMATGQQQYNPNVYPAKPPGVYQSGIQDANSNSPIHQMVPPNNMQNNYNQSASGSPAFNHPGMNPTPVASGGALSQSQTFNNPNMNTAPIPPHYLPPNSEKINHNTPPPMLSNSVKQLNGPTMFSQPINKPPSVPSSNQLQNLNQHGVVPPLSSSYLPPGSMVPASGVNQTNLPPMPPPNLHIPPGPPLSQPSTESGPPMYGSIGNNPIVPGPTVGVGYGPPKSVGVNGSGGFSPTPVSFQSQPKVPPQSLAPTGLSSGPTAQQLGPPKPPLGPPPISAQSRFPSPPVSAPPINSQFPPNSSVPTSSQLYPPSSQTASPGGPPSQFRPGPPSGPPYAYPLQNLTPSSQPSTSTYQGPPRMGQMPPGMPSGPQNLQPTGLQSGPNLGPPSMPNSMGPQQNTITRPPGPPLGPQTMQQHQTGPPSLPPGPPAGPPGLQSGPTGLQTGPPVLQTGPPSGPSNMQNRYPQMPPSNYNHQGMPPNPAGYQQQQYNTQGITQQMGNLSVTNQGFDQLWGHQVVDLMQCKNVLPEYPEDPPEIRLGPQFADAPKCSPEIFRCTINKIPETNSLLQKSRLPLGIIIHPFKDLNHLPVIQCATIVRCRACRTYINPFVYFVDSKRWKCNLCFRVNDLPQEFQYDPVSKSYGDPCRRPEIRSATIEFIAPGEYMLRPPQPAVYLFLFDVSQLARESGYLEVVCESLLANLDQLPGDSRTQVAFICFDSHIHYYLMCEGLTRPKEMTVLDIEDVFLPSPESLLVNLAEQRQLVEELLQVLPRRHSSPGAPASALGAALQAAYKLAAPTGGRITVFQTCLPNIGPGALQSREDPNARSSKDVAHLSPATDFYKRLALECSGAQVAVDLFLLNSQYCDLATLSGMSKFSAGSVYHIPLFKASRSHLAGQLRRMLHRYLTRKIGFEAVMRVRCTRGVSIHTFHGNFFVRSTDLLSLPNVSPDNAFAMQLAVEENLSDLQQICFQAALLYTSSKGERRIRVHTLALPVAATLTDVLHSADQHCIASLLCKMAVDRSVTASLPEAREALINVAVDVLSAHKLAQNLPAGAGLMCPVNLRLLPTYILAALKSISFRTGTSTRLDDRVAHMTQLKTLPLSLCLRAIHPALYAIHNLGEAADSEGAEPPMLPLSAESVNATGAYLLDTGETYIIFVCHAASPAFLSETFGVASFTQLADEARTLPKLEEDGSQLLHLFIERLNDERPYDAEIIVLRDNSPSRRLFYDHLTNDRLESAFSYYEFLQHIKSQVK